MTTIPIRLVGDPVLREPAKPVETFDAELRQLVKDLRATLAASGGLGLAAPQLGVGLRAFALQPGLSGRKLDHLVNPVLSFPDEAEQDGPEGCLSLPGVYLDTKRRMNVVAKGFSMHGDPVQVVGDGTLARCVQHETDHLDGILFVDRQSPDAHQRLVTALAGTPWSGGQGLVVKVSPH